MAKLDHIERSEVLRYMGHQGEPESGLDALIDRCEEILLRDARPKYIFAVYDILRCDDSISLSGCRLELLGNDIKAHLEGCERAALICATLSVGADAAIRRAEVSEMALAFAMDAAASAAIEQFLAMADEEMLSALPGYYGTWRFSPGYGDFPIEVQKDFVSALNAQKRIGLCVSESGILTPRKSVTAVMGLSREPLPKKRRGCAMCAMNRTCLYRKRGGHCGF